MGFRSTFVTEDYDVVWPKWFCEKYNETISFGKDGKGALHSFREAKIYKAWESLPDDIRIAIDWDVLSIKSFILVFLHECGGVTRCQIERDQVKWSEPDLWRETDGVTHHYCYGCSDTSKLEVQQIIARRPSQDQF